MMSKPQRSNESKFALAIELSNPSSSLGGASSHAVAVFSLDGQAFTLIDSLPVPSTVRSADALMMLVETLCTKHQIDSGDLDRIVVSVGPGGYTALRISSTTAKVLAYVLGCALYPVPSARVAGAAIGPSDRPALIALASKKNQAHCSVLAADGSLEAVGVIDADAMALQVQAHGVRAIVSDVHLPESFAQRAKELGVEVVPIELDVRHVLAGARGIAPVDPTELMPIYAREPDAITQWRARQAQ